MIGYIIIAVAAIILFFIVNRRGLNRVPTHAGGIVCRQQDGHTLILVVTASTNKSKWVLPKGRIEKNESAEFAAIREVMEETGVAAKPVKQAGTIAYKRRGKRIRVVYFSMQFEAFHNTSTEDRKIAWVEKDEAIKMLNTHKAISILQAV